MPDLLPDTSIYGRPGDQTKTLLSFLQFASKSKDAPTADLPPEIRTGSSGGGGDTGDIDFDSFAGGVRHAETGGERNPYRSVTSTGTGHKVYGAYQIYDDNIAPWSKAALGRALTPQQFLASSAAQEAVARYKLQDYVDKYGYHGAARAWLAGEGGMNSRTAMDRFGSTPYGYADKVLSHARRLASAPPSFSTASAFAPETSGAAPKAFKAGSADDPLMQEFEPTAPAPSKGKANWKGGKDDPLMQEFEAPDVSRETPAPTEPIKTGAGWRGKGNKSSSEITRGTPNERVSAAFEELPGGSDLSPSIFRLPGAKAAEGQVKFNNWMEHFKANPEEAFATLAGILPGTRAAIPLAKTGFRVVQPFLHSLLATGGAGAAIKYFPELRDLLKDVAKEYAK